MTIKQFLTDSRGMLADRKGATAIEYGLIAAGVALVVVAAMVTLTPALEGIFGDITAGLNADN